jgi:hypothetical protein
VIPPPSMYDALNDALEFKLYDADVEFNELLLQLEVPK